VPVVLPPYAERRRTVLAQNLEDLAVTPRLALMVAMDDETITHLRLQLRMLSLLLLGHAAILHSLSFERISERADSNVGNY
jgi:hypothetical protein